MTKHRETSRKLLAIAVGLVGVVCIIFGSHNRPLRGVGAAILILSTQLLRESKPREQTSSPQLESNGIDRPIRKRLPLIISVPLVLVIGAALFWLQIVAAKEGHQVWVVIAVVSFIGFMVWVYMGRVF